MRVCERKRESVCVCVCVCEEGLGTDAGVGDKPHYSSLNVS